MPHFALSLFCTETRDNISDLEPAGIEEELQQGEYRHVEVEVVVWIALSRVQELAANETDEKETVHGQSHHLEDRDSDLFESNYVAEFVGFFFIGDQFQCFPQKCLGACATNNISK